jgi:phenylpropionate dioxygenase-like ring-hydroxylating dioxygenase large terminal subunit
MESEQNARNAAARRAVGQRDELRLEGRDKGGWHQNWYVLARSSDVGPEEVIARDVLGGRLLAWRTKGGKLVVSSPWCQHLGADLSVGKVVGDKILCAFHHWEYGPDGCGLRNYFGEELPKTARLRVFPSVERFGLIWFFNGEKPAFDPPGFEPFREEDLFYDAYESPTFPQPHWVLLTNSHDYQHLRILHDMKLTGGPSELKLGTHVAEHDASFEFQGMPMDLHVRVSGTNTITLSARFGPEGPWMLNMYSGTPRPEGVTTGFSIAAAPLPPDATDEMRTQAASFVAMGKAWTESLFDDDAPVMNTLSFNDAHLLDADKELKTFLDWVRRYPKADLV